MEPNTRLEIQYKLSIIYLIHYHGIQIDPIY